MNMKLSRPKTIANILPPQRLPIFQESLKRSIVTLTNAITISNRSTFVMKPSYFFSGTLLYFVRYAIHINYYIAIRLIENIERLIN